MVFNGIAVAICALSGVGETVLLDFQADWCGPCRQMQGAVAHLESVGYPVRQVNIDREPQLAARYGVTSIPCFVAVVNGQERGRLTGATSYERLQQMITAAGVRPGAQANSGAAIAQTNSPAVVGAGPNAGPRGGDTATVTRGQSPDGFLHRLRMGGRRSADASAADSSAPAGAPGGLAPPNVSIPTEPTGPPPAGMPPGSPAPLGGRATDLASLPTQGSAGASAPANNAWPAQTAAGPNEGGMNVPEVPANIAGPSAANQSAPPPDANVPSGPQVVPLQRSDAVAGGDDASLQRRIMASSIRLRVEDNTGNSFGSGTIIDQRMEADGRHGEALVLTCGHIFRDSKGQGTIRIDRFDGDSPQSVAGRLLKYDLARDIALVTFKTDGPVSVARLATAGHQSHQGDAVTSVGCDNGQQPSLRRSRVTAINSIVGPPNLQVAGQPAVGRSGGGLFDSEGRVIGVCNFADPQEKAGLFADVTSAQEVLDQAGLAAVYRQSGIMETGLAKGPATPAPPPMADNMPGTVSAPDSAAGSSPSPGEVASTSRAGSPVEVICIVRSGNGREARRETIFIDNASTDLLDRLASEKRTSQSAFPTSLTVAKNSPQTSAKLAPEPDTTTHTASAWQPTWR